MSPHMTWRSRDPIISRPRLPRPRGSKNTKHYFLFKFKLFNLPLSKPEIKFGKLKFVLGYICPVLTIRTDFGLILRRLKWVNIITLLWARSLAPSDRYKTCEWQNANVLRKLTLNFLQKYIFLTKWPTNFDGQNFGHGRKKGHKKGCITYCNCLVLINILGLRTELK